MQIRTIENIFDIYQKTNEQALDFDGAVFSVQDKDGQVYAAKEIRPEYYETIEK